MVLRSPAFQKNHPIPRLFSQEGHNISPPLEWRGLPPNARELVLICEDPDAAGDEPYVHWMIYNIPASLSGLPQGIPRLLRAQSPIRADQGKNSGGEIGYLGPLPPIGHGVHHYIFRLYALDAAVAVRPGVSDPEELLEIIEEHIIDAGQLVGTYVRTGEALRAA